MSKKFKKPSTQSARKPRERRTAESGVSLARPPRFADDTTTGDAFALGQRLWAEIEGLRNRSARARIEEALRDSEKRYRLLFDNAADAIFIIDTEGERAGRIVSANESAARMHGYSVAELTQLSITDLDTPEAARDIPELVRRIKEGEWIKTEIAHRRKDGSVFPVELSAGLIEYAGNQYILGIDRDITGRKRAEEALLESEERFRNIFSQSPIGIGVYDMQGALIELNEAAMTLFGISRISEMRGLGLFNCPAISEGERAALLKGERLQKEVVYDFDQIEERGLLETTRRGVASFDRIITPLHSAAGAAPTGYLVQFIDISERKRAEEGLRAAHVELERRAYELDAVNRELEGFSYTVSHDLKAPLRRIEGFVQAIWEDCADRLDERGRDYLTRVTSASQRMSQLIEAMLNIARLTGGELRGNVVDLSDLAHVVAHDLQRSEPRRKVTFIIAEKLKASCDATMLKVMLENLIGNAWKFTGKHETAVIEFGADRVGDQRVYFIRDDGAGFTMEYADKLFRPFQRLHAAAEFPGLGIGLAIAHRIVTRHNGRIWAEGAPEKGATFFFTL